MKALRETIPGSAQRKRHKRRCQGADAIDEQVTNGVSPRVLINEEPLEDLPVGADGDPQGEHRGPQRNGPTLGYGALVEQEVEREANREGHEGVGQLVVKDDLVEEVEHEVKGTRKRRQREEHVEECGMPVASQEVSE